MILYVHTSALVPLLIEEPSTSTCEEAWNAADVVLVTWLAYVEASAALGQAVRQGRISEHSLSRARARLDELWDFVHVLAIDDDEFMRQAASTSVDLWLRGYDAVHCAAAIRANDEALVVISGDARLLGALDPSGVATLDANHPAG